MRYEISARRLDATGSLATAHGAEVRLATGMQGRKDALTPVELPLSALAACMIKGTKRVTPKLNFQPDGRTVKLEADRQDSPPKLTAIRDQITVATSEPDARVDLLHRNILKYGTISNRLTAAIPLTGTIRTA